MRDTRGHATSLLIATVVCTLALAGCAPRTVATGVHAGRSTGKMKLTSPAFSDGGRIPQVYTGRRAGGADQSIPFEWTDVPEGTRSFLLAIVDHAPVAREWVHWVVVDMPPDARSLPAGASRSSGLPWGSHELFNTGGGPGYTGPVPPAGTGDHPYEATVYALSVPRVDTLPRQPTAEDVAAAVARITLDSASLTGTYSQ